MRNTLVLLTSGLAAFVLGSGPSRACTCSDFWEKMFELNDAVFRGHTISYVVEYEGDWAYYVHQFVVVECWKGNVPDLIEIRTEVDGASCGILLSVGTEWIVFAGNDGVPEGLYSTGLCGVFSPGDQAMLDFLAEPGTVERYRPMRNPGVE